MNRSFPGPERRSDPLDIPIADLDWSTLEGTIFKRAGGFARRALEESGLTTAGELSEFFEDRSDRNLHWSGISGFGESSYQATRYLFQLMGIEIPRLRFN